MSRALCQTLWIVNIVVSSNSSGAFRYIFRLVRNLLNNTKKKKLYTTFDISCLNFWDEAWWFLSLRIFGLCLHFYCYFHNDSADVSSDQQDTWDNGYRRWFPELLRKQSSGGSRFNPDCRRVTIQEYLTLVPGYG